MSASHFISLLESKGLLDPEIIAELRRQVEQSKVRVTPEAISRLLVDNGQLTRFQATKLVTELNETLGPAAADATTALRGGRPLDAPKGDHDSVEDLLPEDSKGSDNDVVVVEEVEEVVEVSSDDVVEVVAVTSKPSSRSKKSNPSAAPAPVRPARPNPNTAKKNPWESFGVLGLGFILLLLLIPFAALVIWFQKGNSEKAFKDAKEAYEVPDYERASKLYADFADTFSSDPNASQARIRSVLAKIRLDTDKSADPIVASKTAQESLPTIASENAMTELRVEVADALLKIAEKYISRADNISDLAERRRVIEKLNDHMELIRDPRFVGTQEKKQNEIRIEKIEEGQKRVLRVIQLGEDLKSTIAAMTGYLESNEIMKSYNARRDLIRKYPQLETDETVNKLLRQATSKQKDLVQPVQSQPTVSNELPKTNVAADVLLVNRKLSTTDRTSGTTFFLRVKGSVVAMDAADGRIVWRQFIGLDWTGEPKRLTTAEDSDVLVSFPEQGMLRRLAAKDGSLVWESKFDARIVNPSIDGDDIFVSTVDGKVYCIDAISGQSKWGKKLPQPVQVGVGGGAGSRNRYVLGDHSNLYIMSRGNGQCDEVVYVGHNPGTIAVPPIWILNQLIIFENAGPDYSLMRIFTSNDEGKDLQVIQNSVRFKGHVVVEPQIEKGRLAVVTNLGEIQILEVEKGNAKQKVSKFAGLITDELEPKVAWPLLVGNDMWVVSNHLAAYQVQVSRQILNSLWQREDGDQFTGRPQKVDDVVIHSRVVRGNLGVRVTAINPTTGDPVWQADVGSPVTTMATAGSKGFFAMTSQGAAFSFDAKSFANKALDPSENLGRNQRSMMFSSPVLLKDSRIAVLNEAQGNQLLLIDPERKSGSLTRMVALDLNGATPSAQSIAVGQYLVVPLNNAQLALIDPEQGKLVGTAFQPTIQAGELPKWLNPVLLSDSKTIIVADEKRNIYKLSTGTQLRSIDSRPLDRPLKRRLAVIRDVVVAVSTGTLGDQLDFFSSEDLKLKTSLPADGRFAWGPYAIPNEDNNTVLALSDIEGLIACDSTGKKLWSTSLDKIVLVGTPVMVDNDCLLATTTGELIRISLNDGSVIARAKTGEPISGPPLVLPKGILVPCDEGRVVTVPMPKAGDASSGGDTQ